MPSGDGIRLPLLNEGYLTAVTGDGGLPAFSVAVPDPGRVAAALEAAGIPHDLLDGSVLLRAKDAHGVDILLGPAAA